MYVVTIRRILLSVMLAIADNLQDSLAVRARVRIRLGFKCMHRVLGPSAGTGAPHGTESEWSLAPPYPAGMAQV